MVTMRLYLHLKSARIDAAKAVTRLFRALGTGEKVAAHVQQAPFFANQNLHVFFDGASLSNSVRCKPSTLIIR